MLDKKIKESEGVKDLEAGASTLGVSNALMSQANCIWQKKKVLIVTLTCQLFWMLYSSSDEAQLP